MAFPCIRSIKMCGNRRGEGFCFSLLGIVLDIGMLIGPGTNPEEYVLHWDWSKVVTATVTASMLGVVVGVLEARRWLKGYWETVRTLAAEGKNPSALLYPAQPGARQPFWR
ncbi:hypothetical protein J2W76_002873 [Methylorubrum zatmanii]|nr:hypothetical protein [Methylorubrum zatmanii]MCP1549628.1 hypothetical protein [Methylorubrum zatmanii]MCP1553758.1 hypothetical protein [Methylorubrum extorquens]